MFRTFSAAVALLLTATLSIGLAPHSIHADDAAPAANAAPTAEATPATEAALSAAPEAVETPAAEVPASTGGSDWTYWRGPQMNGNSTETGLVDSWDPEGGEGSNLLWKREELGSRSTPIVMNGRLYIVCRDKPYTEDEGEKLVCVDAATGQTIWEQRWNVYLSDVPDTRVAWSSAVGDPETGNIYTLGVCGVFSCFQGDTGELLWRHSMHEEYGLLSTYGGRTNFPIIFEDNVIISAVIIGWGEKAKPQHSFLAFDKYNGQPVWFEGTRPLPHDTTYSAPVFGVFDGQAAMVFGSGDGGVHAYQPRTGKSIWSYALSERGVNTSPLIYKDYVICGHSEENIGATEMGALVCLNGRDGSEVWKTTERFVGKSPPTMAGEILVSIDDRGKLFLIDPATGEEFYSRKVDTVMRASPLYADGKLYVLTANGRWWIFKIVDEGEGEDRKVSLEELHKDRLNGEEGHASPIVSNGRLYVTTTSAVYCIGQEGAEAAGGVVPPLPPETPREDDQTPALVQVVPVEGLLYPGDKQPLGVRLYNANGQWIRNAEADEVTFSVQGTGAVEGGAYSTDAALRDPGAGIITATVGELSGEARIRVVPNLPWSFSFDDGTIPVSWVGIRYRHVPLDFDLFQSLQTDDPQVALLYVYFTSEFTNFGPARTFDDSTPAQRWTGLLRFLNMLGEGDKPKTLEEAQAKLDAKLQKLVDAGVLASFNWTTWDRTNFEGETVKEPKLEVARGERRVDGNGVMCKITTIPKGARSRGWIGHPSFKNYTIQADVFTPGKNGQLPDIGLVDQRYSIDLQGASQKFQIRAWAAQLYYSQTVDFAWEKDTWYTIKFQSDSDGQKAILRGKVWKQGEEEPSEWTVTTEDPHGNLQGSPGFYGNAKDAEIFYDNVTVTLNQPAAQAADAAASGD